MTLEIFFNSFVDASDALHTFKPLTACRFRPGIVAGYLPFAGDNGIFHLSATSRSFEPKI
jgi:hypothetical protein